MKSKSNTDYVIANSYNKQSQIQIISVTCRTQPIATLSSPNSVNFTSFLKTAEVNLAATVLAANFQAPSVVNKTDFCVALYVVVFQAAMLINRIQALML